MQEFSMGDPKDTTPPSEKEDEDINDIVFNAEVTEEEQEDFESAKTTEVNAIVLTTTSAVITSDTSAAESTSIDIICVSEDNSFKSTESVSIDIIDTHTGSSTSVEKTVELETSVPEDDDIPLSAKKVITNLLLCSRQWRFNVVGAVAY